MKLIYLVFTPITSIQQWQLQATQDVSPASHEQLCSLSIRLEVKVVEFESTAIFLDSSNRAVIKSF